MILDYIENYRNYLGLGEKFRKAFDFLINTDLEKLELGKHPIDGDNIFAVCMEYDTKPIADGRNEGHRKYIDVQYVVSGHEQMHSAPINGLEIIEEYNEDSDVLFYENKSDCIFEAFKGSFAIFWPEDAHMPGMATGGMTGRVKKIVVKVNV